MPARLGSIESFGNGAWHLVFHYVAPLSQAVDVRPSANVAAAQWFPLDGLPSREETAHQGWPLDVITGLGLAEDR